MFNCHKGFNTYKQRRSDKTPVPLQHRDCWGLTSDRWEWSCRTEPCTSWRPAWRSGDWGWSRQCVWRWTRRCCYIVLMGHRWCCLCWHRRQRTATQLSPCPVTPHTWPRCWTSPCPRRWSWTGTAADSNLQTPFSSVLINILLRDPYIHIK